MISIRLDLAAWAGAYRLGRDLVTVEGDTISGSVSGVE